MTQRFYASLIFLVALSVILSAWAFELIGGFQPCGLCLQQRIPYYIGVPVAAIALFFAVKPMPRKWASMALWLLALIFAVSVFLAIRHAGVEWQWWLGPANCAAGDLSNFGNGGSLLDALKDVKIAYCDEAAARFLGLSFAGWNAIASLILTLLALKGALAKPLGQPSA